MTKFTGYARNRGFQRIPVRDESRQIQQSSQSVLRDMEAARQRNLQNANNHLQDIRDKHELEKQVRDVNEQVRREYASSYIEAHKRNMQTQAANQEYAINQQQAFVKDLLGFSSTLQGFAEQQIEKQREDQLNQANGIAARIGLTAEQFQQLKTLEGVLEETERQNAPVYEEMLRRGATAEDLNVIINSSGYSRYAFGVASMQQSGRSLERYLSDNGNVQIDGYTTTLNAAEQQGLPEYNDILLRMQQDFISQNLSGFDPAFIAKYGKPEMDRTLARRQDYAAKIRRQEEAKIYDATKKQEWMNLARQGAPAVMQRLQDLTGPNKTRFRGIVERNVPYLVELLEQNALPDNFVDELATVPLQIGNQQQQFGSLHSEVITRLRIAEVDGINTERQSIQAEHQLQRAETEQTMRAVVFEMSEQARNGTLEFNNITATIREMEAQPGVFTQDDINKVKAFLPKTPDAAAAKNTIAQWDLSYARDRQLPSIAEISASPLAPDQKIKWYEKVNAKIEAGLDEDQERRRDEFLKGSLMRELKIADATLDQWGMVHPSVHNLYYKLQKDYDDLFSSDLTQNTNTRHEQAQAAILSRLPAGGSSNPFYSFDGDGFEGKVTSLALPESSPSELTTTQVDNMLKDGNENRLYTQQVVPVSIIDSYLADLSSGKRVPPPKALTYLSRKLGIPVRLALEAQMDVATAADGKDRKVNLPESAEQFYEYVKGTPNATISQYVQSRYHSRNRASRALIGSGLPDPYTDTSGYEIAPQSHTDALINSANDLGVDPLDLATLIGFETGGTYSPDQMGGDGGVYRGLIQFSPGNQKRYGITPGMTFEEQLVAVVQYLKDRFKGVGMSTKGATLLQLYTTVLAGNPKANPDLKDSFGTSSRSGVERMQREHRAIAERRFFSGSQTNPWSHESTITPQALEMMRNR